MTKRLFPQMEVGLMKLILLNCLIGSWSDENMLLNWKPGLMKRMFPEMEAGLTKRMLLKSKREIL